MVVIALSGWCIADHKAALLSNPKTTAIEKWQRFEDPYFNITLQYPPEWKVEKVDVTDYNDYSQLDLAGEDAAVAGGDKYKTWIIRIAPPYKDVQEINRGSFGTVHSAIVIEQPNRVHGNNPIYSDVVRPRDREYEAVLDSCGEGFHFIYSSHAAVWDGQATTSTSIGHSPDGSVVGITATKHFLRGYRFQAYMSMTEKLGHNADNIFVFMEVVNSMRVLTPENGYEVNNYKVPIMPWEYKFPTFQ